jgi:hypothetical protein
MEVHAYKTRELNFDECEALGLDGTGRSTDGMPYLLASPSSEVLFSITFTFDDLEGLDEEAGVRPAEAQSRALEASDAIRDQLIRVGNALLADAVAGVL